MRRKKGDSFVLRFFDPSIPPPLGLYDCCFTNLKTRPLVLREATDALTKHNDVSVPTIMRTGVEWSILISVAAECNDQLLIQEIYEDFLRRIVPLSNMDEASHHFYADDKSRFLTNAFRTFSEMITYYSKRHFSKREKRQFSVQENTTEIQKIFETFQQYSKKINFPQDTYLTSTTSAYITALGQQMQAQAEAEKSCTVEQLLALQAQIQLLMQTCMTPGNNDMDRAGTYHPQRLIGAAIAAHKRIISAAKLCCAANNIQRLSTSCHEHVRALFLYANQRNLQNEILLGALLDTLVVSDAPKDMIIECVEAAQVWLQQQQPYDNRSTQYFYLRDSMRRALSAANSRETAAAASSATPTANNTARLWYTHNPYATRQMMPDGQPILNETMFNTVTASVKNKPKNPMRVHRVN